MPFGEKLSEIIKERGLTGADFLRDLGVPRSTLSGWKTGKRSPKSDMLAKLAKYLDVSLDYLCDVDTKSPRSTAGNGPPPSRADIGDENSFAMRIDVVKSLLPPHRMFLPDNLSGWVFTTGKLNAGMKRFAYFSRGPGPCGSGIGEDDLLIIQAGDSVDNGCVAAVMLPEGGLICRYYRLPEGALLLPESSQTPLLFRGGAAITILGRVVECRKVI